MSVSDRRPHPPGTVVAHTTAGAVAGERTGGITVFRGVPYAQPPVGPLRFASPRPPLPWSGVRDATAFGPASFQSIVPGSGEDSLHANVWTPHTTGSRPVLVYVHGGGWERGAGHLPTYDGARLAARTDMVVVTFNYRLGAFGFGLHEDLTDPLTGSCANWGLQDQAALVRWVHDNAAAFGGDPAALTLCGTSAGGASVRQLALLPETGALVRHLVPISACHIWAPANSLTPEDSRTVYEALAKDFGTTVAGLRDVPAGALKDAWERFFSGPPTGRRVESGREYRGPVVDGRWLPAHDVDMPSPAHPSLVVHTRTEGSFYTCPERPTAPTAPATEAELREAVRDVLLKGTAKADDALVDACLRAYREAAAAEDLPADPLSLWTEIWGDLLFRFQILRLAGRHARTGRSPQYVMEFAHPVRPPYFGTPHEATSKFVFGTHGLPENVAEFGDGPLEKRISDTFMDLVASFARTGAPRSAYAPQWPAFSPERPSTLIVGGDRVAQVAAAPKLRQLRFWDDAGVVPCP
ncbi:carboxylesterase/lipase family protein [Streptomyces sp. ISL-11]|uniref:carboxylesterase/lipase family protein n=1 Tax=Streptomyces sp. ISL-11 TaxID=2819174 RepID=UPI001BE5226F|nr:carboxylesterase family protein [Streptomyces sp. ISL-11]MBT2383737.1 carboxylesterase family protein [Streptomyces sp. ISL-11]